MKVLCAICKECKKDCEWLWPQSDLPNAPLVCNYQPDDGDDIGSATIKEMRLQNGYDGRDY